MSRRFENAGLVESTVWEMRLADYPRGKNRALIDRLFNGAPPWQDKDVDDNNVRTNLNDLSGARYAADARRSLERALENSSTYFKVFCDVGPTHKRQSTSAKITQTINRTMKNSLKYWETLQSQIALKVLHGNGPAFWVDRDHWCPTALAIQDVLIPSRTLRSMENLDHFAVFRQWTYEQLYKMTHGPHVDPAWQMDVVEGALKWVQDQTNAYLQSYAQWYAPQNIEEIIKEDLGYLGTDALATVDVWDFYFHSDEGGREGWRRRIVLDTPMPGEVSTSRMSMPSKNGYDMDHGHWLYKPANNRVYASKLSEIIHFQFGDATATAPFRYHSIRSLGWLLYPFCHLQNRLRSKFIDHLFENLNQYLRVSTAEDHERLSKLDLHNHGEVPESVQFVRQEERWQINMPLLELGFTQNRSLMDEAAAQYREGRESQRPTERETATAVMARVNAANALVGSLLATMYKSAKYQYMEICRRFCNRDSNDPEVKAFRAEILKSGIPQNALNVDSWDVVPDRIIGSGNKMLEVAMADKLMAARALHDPEAQREILEIYDLANTDDPALAMRLAATDENKVTDSNRSALAMVPTLMLGLPVPPKRGENPSEMIETLLHSMATILKRMEATGPEVDDLVGLQTIGQQIGVYLQILGQDKEQSNQVKEYAKDLQTLMAQVQQLGKALAKQKQSGNGAAPQIDPKDLAKVQGMQLQAQTKAQLAAKSHAARTAQKQIQFEMKLKQDQARHQMDMQKDAQRTALDNQLETAKTAGQIRRENMKSPLEE